MSAIDREPVFIDPRTEGEPNRDDASVSFVVARQSPASSTRIQSDERHRRDIYILLLLRGRMMGVLTASRSTARKEP